MMTIKNILYLVAAAMLMTGGFCSCSDDEQLVPAESCGHVVTLKATLGAKGSEATRSLADDGMTTTWTEDEEIAVYYQKTDGSYTIGTATVRSVDGTGKATIEAMLIEPQSGAVKLVYPASLANDNGNINTAKLLANQVGTIADISANWDAAVASGITMTVSGTTASLPGNIAMENQLCIMKYTLQDAAGASLSARALTINDGTNYYVVTPSEATGTLYLAMLPVTDATVSFTASAGSDSYTRSYSGITLAAGKFYSNSTVKMRKYEVGKIIGSDGNIYDTADDVPSAYVPSAMVAYVGGNTSSTSLTGSYNIGGICYDHGLAIALSDISSSAKIPYMSATVEANSYSRKRPQTATAWFLPSANQWMRMLSGCGSESEPESGTGSFTGYGDFRTLLTTCAGGDADVREDGYWTSTTTLTTSTYFNFSTGKFGNGRTTAQMAGSIVIKEADKYYVRSAFAF